VSASLSSTPGPSTPWPATAHWGDEGLEVGGVPVDTLAREFGTPLLVLDAEHLRRRCRELRAAFPRVYFAAKALTARRLLRLVNAEGLRVLAASAGELDACLRAGIPPSHIALHGNCKGEAEIESAVGAGVGLLVCDHLEEIGRADAVARRLGRRQDVLVRVVPGVAAGAHPSLVTGTPASKFGLPIDSGAATAGVLAAVDAAGLRFRGLHAHIGSQVLDAGPFLACVDALTAFAGELARRDGVETEMLDIGGGFGITYLDEDPLDLASTGSALLGRLRTAAAREGIPVPLLAVEPGRAIVGGAGVTLYRVGAVKLAADGRRLAAVDGGMSDNPRPMLYGARHAVAPVVPVRPGEASMTTVVGRHCESGDVIAEAVPLGAEPVGQVLVAAATGAYCYSLSSNYNRTPRPAVVAVRDGAAQLWLRRETHDDLDRLEVTEPVATVA